VVPGDSVAGTAFLAQSATEYARMTQHHPVAKQRAKRKSSTS
jgi:hypothetical protein